MIKAIIFDMDGVLIDAKDWHYESLNKALDVFGFQISRYDHLVTYDGLPTKKKLEMLSMERALPKGLHGLINNLKQIYTMEMIYQRCKPMFCHQRALSTLKSENYKLGVCSNSIRQTIDLMMEKSDLAKYLDRTLSNQDVTHSKPHPEIYEKMMAHFELKPEECLILEDNENGIKAALASGAHLMKIETVYDVSYEKIRQRINEINSAAGKM
ncbi:HAD family phosphatase [Bdellovibrio sp. KM01]|uniref:HAD family hydrolase n=1 Tax=Bdellovibrio sp. KM01 TaxID=2748865 RepID=UPI0015E9F805|nr:HAD-IA family hydrolase [Bdellovibrio sp. KM01]QLY27045.1 HAD-IA family hydrolase [Bdellovibrio sp. KM01]